MSSIMLLSLVRFKVNHHVSRATLTLQFGKGNIGILLLDFAGYQTQKVKSF